MKKILNEDIFLSYYGDDFTGSTDVMESLALNGIATALFLQPPEPHEVERFKLKVGVGDVSGQKRIKAFGVAGIGRSLSPCGMDQALPPIFEKISRIPADFFHYKVCSTFDSSPEVGNIGHATDLALQYFPSDHIPLLVGAPFLNRFVVFANLFARVNDVTYRLDRHPTMSRHPVTPMQESDLRNHLALQTGRPVNHMDVFTLDADQRERQQIFQSLVGNQSAYLLFDTYSVDHLVHAGELMLANKQKGTQLLVGSSGMDYALAFPLQKSGKIAKPMEIPKPGKADNLIVMGGSCSPVTAGQLKYMIEQGNEDIRIDTMKLINELERNSEIERVERSALKALDTGKVPVMYTATGPDDPSIEMTKHQLSESGNQDVVISELLAGTQGVITREILEKTGKCRVVVAGGDTSGYVSRALGIYALETLCPIAPGAPLCVAHSTDRRFDGLEISLKGGQNGNEKYFESILQGKIL